MKIVLEEIDSQVFGRNILQIREPEQHPDFGSFEIGYLNEYAPFYAYVKTPAEDLALIHYFEDQGFRFVEFQLLMTKRLPRKKYDTAMIDGILSLKEIGPEEDIEPILELADDIFDVDRVYCDPVIGPDLAKKRYRAYIRKSWQSPKERVIKGYDLRNNNLVSFHTHLRTGPADMLHFLGGTSRPYQASGAAVILQKMMFNNWIDEGLKNITTHISLSNYKIMESEYKALDFKPRQSYAVLRKIYRP